MSPSKVIKRVDVRYISMMSDGFVITDIINRFEIDGKRGMGPRNVVVVDYGWFSTP